MTESNEPKGPVKGWLPIVPRPYSAAAEFYARNADPLQELNAAEKGFASLAADTIARRCPQTGDVRILDISANDLRITSEVCQLLEQKSRLNNNKDFQITVLANDAAYAVPGNNPLKEIAQRRAEQITTGPVHMMVPLLSKHAQDIRLQDVGGKRIYAVIDRAGAVWNAVRNNSLPEVEEIFTVTGSLLADDGIFIVDGPAEGISGGFATSGILKLLVEANGMSPEDFAQHHGYTSVTERSGPTIIQAFIKKARSK